MDIALRNRNYHTAPGNHSNQKRESRKSNVQTTTPPRHPMNEYAYLSKWRITHQTIFIQRDWWFLGIYNVDITQFTICIQISYQVWWYQAWFLISSVQWWVMSPTVLFICYLLAFAQKTKGRFHQTLTGCQSWLDRPIWRKFGHLRFSYI